MPIKIKRVARSWAEAPKKELLANKRQLQIKRSEEARAKFIRLRDGACNIVSGISNGEFASLYFTKDSTKKDKAMAVAKAVSVAQRYVGLGMGYTARNLNGTIYNTWRAATGLSRAKAVATATGHGFEMAAMPMAAFYGTVQTAGAIKQLYNFGYNARADLKVSRDRKIFQREIKGYNPETGKFVTLKGELSNQDRILKMQMLLTKKYEYRYTNAGDVSRSRTQVLGDYVYAGSEFWNRIAVAAHSFTQFAPAVALTAKAVPIYTIFAGGTLAAINAYRTGMHICAMNNAKYAQDKTESPFLKQFSDHVFNQRVDAVRIRLVYTTAYTTLAIGNIATTCAAFGTAGIATPVALGFGWASAVSMGAVNTIGTMYDLVHSAQLDRMRARANKKFQDEQIWEKAPVQGRSRERILEKRQLYFKNVCSGKDGLAFCELITLKALRSGYTEEKAQAVRWLKNIGFSDNTIAKIQLTPYEADAMKALRTNLYINKLQYRVASNRFGHKTFGQIVGINSAVKAYQHLRAKRSETVKENINVEQLAVKFCN